MAKRHPHQHHRIRFERDLSRNHSNASLPDEKDSSGRAFLVFGHTGKEINAQGRRAHAARVGHTRAMKALAGEENSTSPGHPLLDRGVPAPYTSLLTTFRTWNSSKKHANNSMIPTAVPLSVEDDNRRTEADRHRLALAALKHRHSVNHLQLNAFPLDIQGRTKAAYIYCAY